MAALARGVGALVDAAAWLGLPLALLLFLQWPLREWVQSGSREANDLAQILFALYVAVAVTAATRERAHLATNFLARLYPARWRERLERAASLAIAAPAAAYVIWTGAPPAWQSVVQLERFPETLNAGYFLLRVAVLLLAALVLAQALLDVLGPRRA